MTIFYVMTIDTNFDLYKYWDMIFLSSILLFQIEDYNDNRVKY